MDTVTYPQVGVKKELASWVLVRVNIAQHPKAAELLQVGAIPVAVAVTAAGEELGRIENYVEAAAFRKRLAHLRRRSAP